MQKIVTNLWFDGRVEEALELYTSCFEDARVTSPNHRFPCECPPSHQLLERSLEMRVIVLVKATKDSEAGAIPSIELIEAMGRYNKELVDAGIMQSGDGVKPSSQGKRVAFDGDDRTVIDGPFPAIGELVAGFWLWEVKDMDEALEWVKRSPNPTRYAEAGIGNAGDIMTAEFELAGQQFCIVNGGPYFTHSPAMSLAVRCVDQDEVDKLWERLTSDGGEESRCGWLVDRFGVSWQIIPIALGEMLASDDAPAVERVTEAFLKMNKLDIAELEKAFRNK